MKVICTIAFCIGVIAVLSATTSKKIPFQTVGQLIIFQAAVDGRTGNFVLDSGIPTVILNRSYFKGRPDLNEITDPFHSAYGANYASEADYVELQLQGEQFKSYATIVDLSILEKEKDLKILGLIGLTIFQKYELEIDFAGRMLILHDLDRKNNRIDPEPFTSPVSTLTLQKKGHIYWIPARIDDLELRLGLDTGAGVNILSLSLINHTRRHQAAAGQRISIGLNGNARRVPSAWITDLQVEQLKLPPMETLFLSLEKINHLFGRELDGLLGVEFLQHFRTSFNLKKKELYLWPPPANDERLLAGERH